MLEWLTSLGYLGAFLGAIVEGEMAFLTAIEATRLGYLEFYYVLLAFFLGAQAIDWTLYLTGKQGGQAAIDSRPKLKPRFDQMALAVEERSTLLLLSYRFMYGFRIVLPTLFGVLKVPIYRFAIFSFISTLLWVLVIGNLSFFFSKSLFYLLSQMLAFGPYILFFAVLGGLVVYWARRHH